jgi:hypothetical protein
MHKERGGDEEERKRRRERERESWLPVYTSTPARLQNGAHSPGTKKLLMGISALAPREI